MKEMSEGLMIKDGTIGTVNSGSAKEDQNEEEDSSVVKADNKIVKNVKKTLVQRRKQREQKQEANKRSLVKCEKKKLSDIYKLRVMQKDIETLEKKQEFLRQKRMKKREEKSSLPKTLGRIKFEAMDSDFQLTEELTGNLRNCKSSMNLLKDRYKSLQQRNIIVPTVIKL
jgi:nucleolar protein 53